MTQAAFVLGRQFASFMSLFSHTLKSIFQVHLCTYLKYFFIHVLYYSFRIKYSQSLLHYELSILCREVWPQIPIRLFVSGLFFSCSA